VAVVGWLVSGCAGLANHGAGGSAQRAWVEDTLYFGMSSPDGAVTEEQWQAFLAEAVTPRFPEGLTVWPAAGQWRGADGAVRREAARVLVILRPATPDGDQTLAEIVAQYKRRFRQEAVLQVRQPAQVAF
jgi:hypothetical protein